MGEGLLQPTHLILIMAIAMLLFGGGKLGETGAALGKSVREFRRAMEAPDEPPRPVAARHCPQCGAAIEEANRFCPSCGAAVAQLQEATC